ncbi:MAG: MgtC/SapB family protein [Rhodopseudomonas sp.]|uniref:MgtC/SapB family protein n=1 Tax=Rhodopseudomonas sp. TaxID=1078 RepID=UPI001797A78D|nr:DUF4010 domain-containing protein [Rhodopseudomonas sp.]NVN86002.1 MgtC/SapB family protein [Rhodopseudomonas sp.]
MDAATFAIEPVVLNLAVALGIGLLIGAERERRKGEGPFRAPAGIRTFAVTSLSGAISILVGGEVLLAVATAGIIVLATFGYWRGREDDPGLTTEVALIATVMLGGLAMERAGLAGGLGVTVALLLVARSRLHRFVRSVLTESELEDALIFAGASLVVLPLVPDRAMGPYGALNPHSIWIIVLLIMAIGAAGHVAVRLLGARFGLPLAGLASGFVSSTVTIAAMGARAAKSSDILASAVGGAALSTVATIVLMAAVLAATSAATLHSLAVPLVCAGLAAVVYGAAFTIAAFRQQAESEAQKGHAFSLSTALAFALTLSGIMLAGAALQDWFGERGVLLAVALAGFVDIHSGAISVASLVANGKMTAGDAIVPILAGFSTNTISKIVFARTSGGRAFAVRVVPGLIFVALAAWAGALVAPIAN